MKSKKDIIIIIMSIVIVAALSGYYYFQAQISTEEEVLSEKINSIAAFSIVRGDLDEATKQRFGEQFDALRTKFLNDQSITNFFVINAMGRIKQDVGDYRGAEEAFLFAYKLDPNGYIINGNLANLYHYGLKDYDKAERFYLDTLSIDGIQEGNHYTYFAEAYELYFYRIEDNLKAGALIERALTELPDNIRILTLSAGYYKDIGDITRAKELYETVLSLEPDNTFARQALESINE
jgi:tetratricopeptide (TPR) repeat protein